MTLTVTAIRTHPLSVPLRQPYRWAPGAPAEMRTLLVEVLTDAGITGYGEAAGTNSVLATRAAVETMAKRLVGTDAFGVELAVDLVLTRSEWNTTPRFAHQAFAGLEMALWDACGKALGQPVHRLLGGRVRDTVGWFGFLQGDEPAELGEEARRHREAGFDALYFKVGVDDERDVAAAAAVRTAAGPAARLRADANGRWDRVAARRMIARLAPFDLEWIEQPLAQHDLRGAALLRAVSPVPIALDQSVYTDHELLEVVRQDAADVVVVGFHETGGLLALKKVAAIAAAAGLRLNRHATLGETGLSTRAALQVLATIPNLADGHQVMHPLLAEDVLVDGLLDDGPSARVPNAPGLGAEVDWDQVARLTRRFEGAGS